MNPSLTFRWARKYVLGMRNRTWSLDKRKTIATRRSEEKLIYIDQYKLRNNHIQTDFVSRSRQFLSWKKATVYIEWKAQSQSELINWILTDRLLDADESKMMIGSVAVVEEEFLARGDKAFRINPDAMITIDHDHFRVTIRIDWMVGKAYLISTTCCINHIFLVQIEEKARADVIIHSST